MSRKPNGIRTSLDARVLAWMREPEWRDDDRLSLAVSSSASVIQLASLFSSSLTLLLSS